MHTKLRIMYCISCYLPLYVTQKVCICKTALILLQNKALGTYMELIDTKIWISKNRSLCWVFVNWATFGCLAKDFFEYTYIIEMLIYICMCVRSFVECFRISKSLIRLPSYVHT